MYPELDPARARSGLPAATASALTLPSGIRRPACVQLCAPSRLRQIAEPPIHSRFESLGSSRNGVMNRKLSGDSVMPDVAAAEVAPPLSDRRRESPVDSK